MSVIRPSAAAGHFYPADPAGLRKTVRQLLRAAINAAAPANGDATVKAIIAPHAGYPYSGAIAANAYARLAPRRAAVRRVTPRRVLLIGPAHRAPVRGLAASSAAAFATPLGAVPLDRQAVDYLLQLPFVSVNDEAHAPEHGLEVHLPFLQVFLGDFHLVPLLAGSCAPEDVAAALQPFTLRPDDLVVVSSDLSHFHDYERARRLDHRTAQRVEALQPLAAADACGRVPINGLLHLAREKGWQARTVDLRNSGDTGGPPHRVVGYGAFIFEGFSS